MPNGAFLDQDDRTDQLTMDVNVYGVIHGMRLVLPSMIERGRGHVVNVASLAGKFPLKGLAVYNASKFGVVGLTAATRLELESTGVSITAVLPSAVRTELSSGIDSASCRQSTPRISRPRWCGRCTAEPPKSRSPPYVGLAANAAPLVPAPVMRLIRKLAHDDAAITRVDHGIRQRYLERINRQYLQRKPGRRRTRSRCHRV